MINGQKTSWPCCGEIDDTDKSTCCSERHGISIGLTAAALSPAHGAPQMMGLVAFNTSQSLQCQRGHCLAEFTAFCLQPERASLARGTAYRVHDGACIACGGGIHSDVQQLRHGQQLFDIIYPF